MTEATAAVDMVAVAVAIVMAAALVALAATVVIVALVVAAVVMVAVAVTATMARSGAQLKCLSHATMGHASVARVGVVQLRVVTPHLQLFPQMLVARSLTATLCRSALRRLTARSVLVTWSRRTTSARRRHRRHTMCTAGAIIRASSVTARSLKMNVCSLLSARCALIHTTVRRQSTTPPSVRRGRWTRYICLCASSPKSTFSVCLLAPVVTRSSGWSATVAPRSISVAAAV